MGLVDARLVGHCSGSSYPCPSTAFLREKVNSLPNGIEKVDRGMKYKVESIVEAMVESVVQGTIAVVPLIAGVDTDSFVVAMVSVSPSVEFKVVSFSPIFWSF